MGLTISPEVTAIGSTSSNTTGGAIIIQGDNSGTSATKSGNTITLSHADTSSANNLSASGRTYVTALTFDGFGHVTGYSTGTETVVDTNTTYSAGTDLSLSGTTFNVSSATTNTGSTLVKRDASGNFSAGTITATLNGNASTATSATSATTAGSITSQANSATITATSNNTANQIVLRDGSGNFSAGVITATATAARYSDLAENYLADAIYEPGTVLMIGGEKEVTIAQEETTKVAGVVSTAPAYIMNSECTGNFVVAIALTGRVPCKVVGTVKKGDLMISAGDGMAKSTGVYSPKIGQVIGKALENFSGNMGTIEVMVGRF
jgi:hypothetical protein